MLSEAVLIDFGQSLICERSKVQHYIDLSEDGSYLEAINKVYEILRWAETKQDAKIVLIANILQMSLDEKDDKGHGEEHKEALYDRIYRATSGKSI